MGKQLIQGPFINRRKFIQVSALSAWASKVEAEPKWLNKTWVARIEKYQSIDAFLNLAFLHRFGDHNLRAWSSMTRWCVKINAQDADLLESLLSPEDSIHSTFGFGGSLWVTMNIHAHTLHRWMHEGLPCIFEEHCWGAPWAEAMGSLDEMERADANEVLVPLRHACTHKQKSDVPKMKARTKCLVIDHGFALDQMQKTGRNFEHRPSHAPNMQGAMRSMQSHGAAIIDLLSRNDGQSHPASSVAYLLYELPDALLDTMPMGAMWVEVIDAVFWGIDRCHVGDTLRVLLSVASTDGDRHGKSFISQSAQAIQGYAGEKQVNLQWVLAAGNAHDRFQNLRLELSASWPAHWVLRMPEQHGRASFMECWHDLTLGAIHWRFKPPRGDWSTSHPALTMAERVHSSAGKVHTVFRLAATHSHHSSLPLTPPGDWVFEAQAHQSGEVHVNLSMAAGRTHLHHQPSLHPLEDNSAAVLQPITINGLVPWGCSTYVAQVLSHGGVCDQVLNPQPQQLEAYCGRWPSDAGRPDFRAVGMRLSSSRLLPGPLVTTFHGHRIYRATGTSMAVPLVAHHLISSSP